MASWRRRLWRPWREGGPPAAGYGVVAAVIAAVSLAAGHALPYDPTSWQIWAGQIVHGQLTTAGGGPAWKPLPVAVATVAMPFGRGAAVLVWLWVVRVAALLGVAAAGAIGGRIAGTPGRVGAALVTLILLLGHWGKLSVAGMSEPVCAAAMLVAGYAFLASRRWLVAAACLVAALIRPEAWGYLLAATLWCCAGARWRPRAVALGASLLAVVPLGWFGPDWLFSGDPLRSLHRAQNPTSGGPLLTAHPGQAVLREAVTGLGLTLLIAVAIALVLATRAIRPALLTLIAAGAGWILLDALLVQAHLDSGDARYLLPGTSLLAAAAGVAPAAVLDRLRDRRSAPPAGALATAMAGIGAVLLATPWSWAGAAASGWRWQQRQSSADRSLAALTSEPIFRGALACGRLMTGGYQVPLVAWQLHLPIDAVLMPADRPGVILAQAGQPVRIPANFRVIARSGTRSTSWTLWDRQERGRGVHGGWSCHPGRRHGAFEVQHNQIHVPQARSDGDARTAGATGS